MTRPLRLVVAILLGACNACGTSDDGARRTSPPVAPEAAEREEAQTSETERAELPGAMAIEHVAPEPIHVRVEDLPEPYATESARRSARVVDQPEGARLQVPPGFAVQRFADDVENARWLRETPDGRVLCAQSRSEQITVFEDADRDGVAESRAVFADRENGVDIPFGMDFARGHFYLGNQDEVRRYPWRDGQARLEGRGERVTALPGGGYHQHWTRNVVVAPDGEHLFVSVGSATNADAEDPPRASVLHMRLDGSERRVFATGLRNPVGLDFHPVTGALYTAVNERDELGDRLVPDYLTRVDDGAFYGWPYAYLTPRHLDPRHVRNGRSVAPDRVARTRTPDVLFEAHSAALGLAFYDRDAFPERYRNGAFVAFRGSWNRAQGTGYMIVFVPFEDGRPLGHYERFVSGFLIDPEGPIVWGRPVGVLVLRDGSLLFTEEPNGAIYRVSYVGE